MSELEFNRVDRLFISGVDFCIVEREGPITATFTCNGDRRRTFDAHLIGGRWDCERGDCERWLNGETKEVTK